MSEETLDETLAFPTMTAKNKRGEIMSLVVGVTKKPLEETKKK